jgi:hypothetical protein
MRLPKKIRDKFRRAGAKGGKIGGKAKVPKGTALLPPERRSEIARKAAAARWGKRDA